MNSLHKKCKKMQNQFECNLCNFITSNKYNFDKHLLTAKHKILTNPYIKNAENETKLNVCICGKIYKHRQTLSKHKKYCVFIQEKDQGIIQGIIQGINQGNNQGNIQGINQGNIQGINQGNNQGINQGINQGNIQGINQEKEEIKDMIMLLLSENKEFKEMLFNQQKQISEIKPGTTNNTNNNNQFNLNFFLNEQCKDAISISQFVESVQVTMENLMTTCHNGLGSGLIKLINDNLNKLSIYERPIHCTDKKRETIYIKNGDTWEKDKDKKGMYDLINKIENKQIKQLGLWTDAHPDFMENDTLSSEYTQLINRCTSSIEACRDKVVKYVCIDNFVKE